MEVARKGIFLPQQFYFEEIMIIFMAVMITDVLLLDFFNSIGLPTSTTVSIVFELLGAAVSIAVIKIYKDGNDLSLLASYINTSKATEIIIGILMAVVIAFIVGLVVQYISRLIFSFQFERKMKYVGSIFGGASLTAILYFILIKGLKSVPYLSEDTLTYINENTLIIILIGFVFFSIISQLLMSLFKLNILRVIIVIGTFALALAFAGNDLVNFIGVPIAAWQSYNLWETAYQSSGTLPSEMLMSGLSGSVPTPEFLLIIAGGVMVVTLWFSSKAKAVVETGVNLARQGDGVERFEPNWLSRSIVRYSVMFSGAVSTAMPKAIKNKIDKKFEKPEHHTRSKRLDAPAFDMVRASVNLVVASILISIGTNLKLPLSTTYVTFMVAMGSSLADRAWDRESAVYRVAGVLNVIGGWFVTALVAFTAAAIFACIIYYGGTIALAILIILAVVLVVRSGIIHSRKSKEEKKNKRYNRTDIITINEITTETSENISSVIHGINRMYTKTVDNLGYHDLGKLKKNNKAIGKLEEEVDELKGNIFYFIKSLDDDSVEASKFYILILDYLQDMTQSIAFITRNSYNHVHNNHKNLKFNQIRDLKKVDERMQVLFDDIEYAFNNHEFAKIDQILKDKQELLDYVSDLIQKQINRIRTSETSPRNTKLYFGLLLETRDLITSTMSLLQLFQEFYREAKSTF